MDPETVLWALCTKDERHPSFKDTFFADNPPSVARDGCSCDSCFSGRDALALEVLGLEAQLQTMKEVVTEACDVVEKGYITDCLVESVADYRALKTDGGNKC
tara:strand:+ start:353 stop:658 length:306 start_codon:yes stop_codon:yes gene_type:complete